MRMAIQTCRADDSGMGSEGYNSLAEVGLW
jgi:hypothetical protein